MIELAGKKYARNDKELVDTLFQGPVTAAGFYRPLKNGDIVAPFVSIN